jgi:hypothetical protein
MPSPQEIILSDERSSFSAGLFQVAWDSTSLGTFKKCPKKYYYSIVLGLRSTVENVHLKFGILTHTALEALDHFFLREDQSDLWTSYMPQLLAHLCLEAGRRDAEGKFHPWVSDHASKNLISLLRAVVWYAEEYAEDSVKTVTLLNGRPATELSFRFAFGETPIGEVQYSGHFDKIARFGDNLWVVDRKTTTMGLAPSYWQQFSPHVQFTGYTFGANMVLAEALDRPIQGVICDAIQVGAGFARFGRRPISYHQEQLTEWYTGAMVSITQAHQYAEAGLWPMNETSCADYGGCPFLSLCSKSPSIRDHFINSAAWQIEKWDPLKVRGMTL